MPDGHLGGITVAKLRIVSNPTGASPINSAPYRASFKERELEREEAAQIEKPGVTASVVTERTSPIVGIPKKDLWLRFRVDHCQLNAVTVRDSHPILSMDERIDSLGEAKLLSALGAYSQYCPIEIDKRDVDKTAFVTHDGL